MSYFLAPSLVQFRDEINDKWPDRDKSADGWIGDTSHQARKSSHNPDWSAPGKRNGVVRAIDVDITDRDRDTNLAQEVVKAAIGDPRAWYVIHKFPGKPSLIWSRTTNWKPKLYHGHPHDGHVHISILETMFAEYNTARWLEAKRQKRRRVPLKISLSEARDQFQKAIDHPRQVEENVTVRRIQRALNLKYDAGLDQDGYCGKSTLNAWGRHERRTDGKDRPRVPDSVSLPRLVQPVFRMVD